MMKLKAHVDMHGVRVFKAAKNYEFKETHEHEFKLVNTLSM